MSTQTDISTFMRLAGDLGGDLRALRQAGLKRFEQTGLPAADDEEWRFTNTDPLAEVPWALPPVAVQADELFARYQLAGMAAELVLINSRLSSRYSCTATLPRGLYVGTLADAPRPLAEKIQARLGTLVSVDKSPFVALNTGLLDEVIVIHADRGVVCEQPLHVLCLSTTAGVPLLVSQRLVIVAEDGAIVRIVTTHAGDAAEALLCNSVTEVFVGSGAVVDHCHPIWLSDLTSAINYTASHLSANARYTHHSVALAGKLFRNDTEVVLDGPHADAALNGLVLAGGQQHVDNHTLIRHEKPDCTSHELYKQVVDEESFGVFKGKVFVQKDAQHTDAKQTNRTLLLSDRARMESMPALEIYADDVKCTHGSTTGPLDEQMLFYLRSRGLSAEAARHLLIYAFAAEITARIAVPQVRQKVERFLAARQELPLDLSIEANTEATI